MSTRRTTQYGFYWYLYQDGRIESNGWLWFSVVSSTAVAHQDVCGRWWVDVWVNARSPADGHSQHWGRAERQDPSLGHAHDEKRPVCSHPPTLLGGSHGYGCRWDEQHSVRGERGAWACVLRAHD